jgi:hypothetical protein
MQCGQKLRTVQAVALEQRYQSIVAGEFTKQGFAQLDDGRIRRGVDIPGIVEVDLEQDLAAKPAAIPSRIDNASHGGSMRLPLTQEADIVMS